MSRKSFNPKVALPMLVIVVVIGLVVAYIQQGHDDSAATSQSNKTGPGSGTSLPAWEVYFSPKGGCTEAIERELGKAKKSVQVQAYSFTSDRIAKALVEAHKRGVKVEVILDTDQKTDKYSEADFLLHAGIPTCIDEKHAIAHNKVMIIDGETVITGSFNFTKAAEERNAENLLILRDKALAEKYEENWRSHKAHSEKYTGK